MVTYLESIQSVHRFFQIFGFSPFSLRLKTALKQSNKNLPLLCYSSLFVLLAASAFGYGVAETIKYLSTTKVTLYVCTDIVLTSGLRIIVTIMFIESMVKYSSQIELLNAFYEIDQYFMTKLSVDMNYTLIKRKLILKHLQWSSLYVCTEMGIIALAVSNSELPWTFGLLFVFPFMVTTAKYLQIVIFVTMLDYRLKKLNNTIRKIHVDEVNENQYLRHRSKRKNYTKRFDENIVLSKIFVLWNIYNRLYDCSKILNYYFQWSLSMNVSLDFLSIVTNLYYFFKQIFGKTLNFPPSFFVFSTIGLFHIIRLFQMVKICHYTAEHVSLFSIRFIIYCWLNNYFCFYL